MIAHSCQPENETFSAQKLLQVGCWLVAVGVAVVVTMTTTDLTVLTGPLEEGSVTSVPFMDVAGLRVIPSVFVLLSRRNCRALEQA